MVNINLDPFNLKVDYKIWFEQVLEDSNQAMIGEKKIELLQAIHQYGSIKLAAEKCNLDFKIAWDMVNNANERFPEHDLVLSKRGRGGGSYLSPLGLELLLEYERINTIIKSLLPKILDGFTARVEEISYRTQNSISVKLQMKPQESNGINQTKNIIKEKDNIFIIPLKDEETFDD